MTKLKPKSLDINVPTYRVKEVWDSRDKRTGEPLKCYETVDGEQFCLKKNVKEKKIEMIFISPEPQKEYQYLLQERATLVRPKIKEEGKKSIPVGWKKKEKKVREKRGT